MRPVLLDPYNLPIALAGTMQSELEFIKNWATDRAMTQNVLWVHGPPGSGKTTLAATIANFYLDINRLGAFIFFDRKRPRESHPGNFICGVAHELGLFDSRIGTVMAAAIDEDQTVVSQAGMQEMFTKLLSEPLRAVQEMPAEGPVVIVIDAMDECGESSWDRRELMKVLVAELATLPPVFRFLITSRPENDLRNHFEQPYVLSHALSPESDETRKDIEAVLRDRLTEIRAENPYLNMPVGWPGDERVEAVVVYSAGNFGRAREACKFIDGHDPEERIGVFIRENALLQAGPATDVETS